MRRRAARRQALLALLAGIAGLLLAGCPGGQPDPTTAVQHEGRAIPIDDPNALLRRIAEVNDGYGTLKSVHKVSMEIVLGGERSEKRTFRGVVAVQRPGLCRLRILGPLGVTLVDLLYRRGETRVIRVAEELRRSSRLPAILDSIAGDLRAIYRLDPVPRAGRRTIEQSVALPSTFGPAGRVAPLYSLKERRGYEVVRQIDVFAASLAVARSEVVDERRCVRTITFGDHRTNGKVIVPMRIHVAVEGQDFYWLSIEVESVTLDEKLDPGLFLAEARGGA